VIYIDETLGESAVAGSSAWLSCTAPTPFPRRFRYARIVLVFRSHEAGPMESDAMKSVVATQVKVAKLRVAAPLCVRSARFAAEFGQAKLWCDAV